ncbi:MAG TPA: metallophosphoesterase family protein [Steroidobacteraceae bacterium]|nr:metallophosphoesterase family protein [Steroidobacteraceae bacterium]
MLPEALKQAGVLRVGVISDTHGLLRAQAMAFLQGCDHIVHGGDIGGPDILRQLAALAPVTAVRGNNDMQAWAASLPHTRLLELGGVKIFVIHNLDELQSEPCPAGVRVVLSGHSHRPMVRERDGVLYVNPGSAGPRRFKLPVSVAQLEIRGSSVTPQLVQLRIAAG